MYRLILLILSSFIFSLWFCACTQPQVTETLPRSTPETEGVCSKGILRFIEVVEESEQEWHSFMLLRYGKVIAEGWWNPYHPDLKHTMYSVSKTFTSTAVGFAVDEGKLSVDDRVISFFPEQLPEMVSDNLSALRVKDLLYMASGHHPDPTWPVVRGQHWTKDFFSVPIVDEPGTKFLYNSLATYMLSAIVQKVTGEKMIDYLTPRLFNPLFIKDVDWEVDPDGVNTGGWGLRIKTEDMAKFGQLYLQKGRWNNQQLLSEEWIDEATTAKIIQKPEITEEDRVKDDWAQGYGYKISLCRNNAFRATGAFGQFIIVMPEQDVVVAITANSYNMQKGLDLVWDYLLPAIHAGQLPADTDAELALQQKLASLSLPPEKGIDSPLEEFLSSKTTYVMETSGTAPTAISIRFKENICYLSLKIKDMDYPFELSKERWIEGETSRAIPNIFPSPSNFVGLPPFKYAGSYSWTDEQTLSLMLRYVESPHHEIITLRFDGEQLDAVLSNSINPNRKEEFTGKKN